jgi:acyl dehydratase
MPDRYWESYEIGEFWLSNGRTITDADILLFAGVSGDFHPAHMDAEYARRNGLLGKRIAHGALLFSISMGLAWQTKMNSRNLTYGIDRVRYPNPTVPGDTVRVKGTVTQKEEYLKRPKYGVVVMRYETFNQDGKCVFVCDHKMLIERQPDLSPDELSGEAAG